MLSACTGGGPPSDAADRLNTSGLEAAERAVQDVDPGRADVGTQDAKARPAAIIGQTGATVAGMADFLFEAAGAEILEEAALTLAAKQALADRGMTIGADAVSNEERLLGETLARNAGVNAVEAPRFIEALKRARGLGPRRYGALLERNAMLRALVREEVQVTPADIDLAYKIRFGERYRTSLILTRTSEEASMALTEVSAGQSFAEVATRRSIDESRSRGGRLEVMSALDPAYPAAVRNALPTLRPGQASGVIVLENGFGILKMDEVIPATTASADQSTAEIEADLEREIRLVRERSAMDRLAGRLLEGTTITPLNDSLRWSWERRRSEGGS